MPSKGQSWQLSKDVSVMKKNTRQDSPIDLTLRGYYTSKQSSASKFLSALHKAKKSGFIEIDAEEKALTTINEHDPDLSKTLALLHKSKDHLKGKFHHCCANFAQKVIEDQLKRKRSPVPRFDVSPSERFKVICDAFSSDLEDKKLGKRAINAVAISVLWLNHLDSPNFEHIITRIRKFLSVKSKSQLTRTEIEKKAVGLIAAPPVTPANVKKLLSFAAAWEDETARERERSRNAAIELATAREKINSLREKNEKLSTSLEGNRVQREREKKEYEQKLEYNKGEYINIRHDLTSLRSRLNATLSRKIKEPIDRAKEAAGLDPPRLAYIEQELEIVARDVEKEIEWLKSSD